MGNWLYVGSCAGKFYGFDRHAGVIRWEFDVSEYDVLQFHGNPYVVDSIIVFGTDRGIQQQKGMLFALNRLTGELIWKLRADPGLPSDVIAEDSLLYVVSHADELIAVRLADGLPVWRFASSWRFDPETHYDRMQDVPLLASNPLASGDTLWFAGRDSTVYCLDAISGNLIWSKQAPVKLTSQLCRADSLIAIGRGDFHLILLNPANGEILKDLSLDVVSHETMAYDGQSILLLGGYEENRPWDLISLDPATGKMRWSQRANADDPDAYWYVPRIPIWKGDAIVGTTTGWLAALSLDDGNLSWDTHLPGAIRGIGHADDLLYVGTLEGMLFALRVE